MAAPESSSMHCHGKILHAAVNLPMASSQILFLHLAHAFTPQASAHFSPGPLHTASSSTDFKLQEDMA
eukprot:1161213-Pelagomonas_calceolata.AAC.4